MVAKQGRCRKGNFFAEMAFTHVGAECVGGPWDFEGFLFFLIHPTIHPYSKLRKALSCGTIHNHFVSSATGQKQSEQSNFLFSCPVCTAVQWAVKLALCADLRPLRRATCLGSRGVEGSTTRCRHLRPVRSHWQTICHGVTASITDQKHQ